MNLQKMSKNALIKEVKKCREYIINNERSREIRINASNPTLDDSFLQYKNAKNQRQLGIIQALEILSEGRHFGYWDIERLAPRESIRKGREEMLKGLKKLMQ